MDYVIKVEGLNKKYPNFELKDVSFAIPTGCVAGFIGLNGQGKTTTIKSILGLSPSSSGRVEILGRDMAESGKEIKDDIAVVFDEGYLYETLKMKEMKEIIARAYTKWNEEKYKALMKDFGLDENQVISTLSKGMRMKFALALALSHRAKFLIMDEPTSGLDPLVRKQLLDILADYMREEGLGLLYSSHITSDLDKFADIIIFIDKGRIVFVEEKDALLDGHRRVKGDASLLNDDNRSLFISLSENAYGFEGVTKKAEELKKSMEGLVIERLNIEDLMLAYIEGGKNHA